MGQYLKKWWERIRWAQDAHQVFQLLVALGGPAIIGVWASQALAVIPTMHPGLQALFWFGAFAVTLPLLWLVLQVVFLTKTKKRFIEFYDDRRMLNRLRGGLEDELRKVEHAWVSWTIFLTAPSIDPKLLRRIDRMVLRHPESPDLPTLAQLSGRSIEHYQVAIREASRIAQAQGIPVLWSKATVPDITIHNPSKGDAWVRVEPFIPRMLGTDRPNFIVRRSERRDLFERIHEAYDKMWQELENGGQPEL